MKTRIPLTLAAVALAGGCIQYSDGESADTGAADTTTDGGSDTTADDTTPDDTTPDVVEGPWGSDLPTYTSVSCDERTALTTSYTSPSCGTEVPIQLGLLDVLESCGGGSDAPEGLHLTYPTGDASSTLAILWTTPNTTRESVVEIGESPDTLDRVYWGTTLTYPGLDGRVVHEVHLCDLPAGKTLYYRAGGDGAWSEVHSFATAPSPTDTDWDITFGVTGDSRSDTFDLWHDAVEQMRALGAEFIVFSGDAVEAGPVQAQWDRFFEQGQPGMAEMPYIPANGNHDLLVANYYGQFALGNDEINFPVQYGQIAFVSMTDFYPADQSVIGGAFAEYLDAQLTAMDSSTWKFVVNHRPFYSASTRHGSADDIIADWAPILDAHEVDMVFNGHDHNYERSKPIRNGAVATDGTIYTVIAGVGAPLYDNGAQWWTEISEKIPSFAIVHATPTQVEYTAYRLDGTTIDSLTLTR